MSTRMRERQAEERTTGGGVPMRRALALQIGEERNALRSRPNRGRLGVQQRRGIGSPGQVTRKLIAIPGERSPCGKHDTHYVPEPRRDVTEGMCTQSGLDERL